MELVDAGARFLRMRLSPYGLFWTSRNINKKNFVEAYHDALQLREDAMNLFNLGYLTLEQRSVTESLYWSICSRVLKMVRRVGLCSG